MRGVVGLVLVVLLVGSSIAEAKGRSGGGSSLGGWSSRVPVRGHVRRDGAYVEPHQRTAPDNTERNNWSSTPNVNPYTGKEGRKEPRR